MSNVEEMENIGKSRDVDKARGDCYSLGMAFYRTEMLDEALERFMVSVENSETAEGSLFFIGMIHYRKGDLQEASKYFKKLLEENPENLVAYNNLAVILEKTGMAREAELLYQEAQKISPLASQIHANIGVLMYRDKNYNRARENLERAVLLNRSMAFAYFYLGMTHLKLSMWDEAEECLGKSLELSPDNPVVCNNFGIFYKKTGDLQKALRYSLKAIEVDDQLSHPYTNIDDIFCIIGEWGECQKYLDEAIPESNRLVKFLLLLGDHYYSKKDFELAHQMWQKALKIKPGNKEIKNRIEKLNTSDAEM
jgi:tetratricopeptide (TPR) repeat protein